jgi:hypothetical protein
VGDFTTVQVIATDPSFEFWLLLHFEYSSSACTTPQVERRLRHHLRAYSKSDARMFDMVATGLDRACENAERLKADLAASGSGSPFTEMTVIVEQLRQLSEARTKL